MNEDQCCTTSTEVDVCLNTENNATTSTFDIHKYAPYVESVRNIFVPNLEKSIYEGLELLSRKNSTKSSIQGFNKCLDVATNVENPLIECEESTGILDRIIKPTFKYLVKEGFIDGFINSVVISNRINKISKNIHVIKTGQNIDEWSFIANDDDYSDYTTASQSPTGTSQSSNCTNIYIENGSESETIVDEFSHDIDDNDGNIKNVKDNLRVIVDSASSVVIISKASDKILWESVEKNVGNGEEKMMKNCCKIEDEKKNDKKLRKLGTKVDWKDKDLTVVISNSDSSLGRNKSSLPCNCENRLREIIKTDSSQSGSQLVEQQKMLEIAMKNSCFTLEDICRQQINYDKNNCQLLRKLREKYAEMTMKLHDSKYTVGSMTNLYIDRVKAYRKDSDSFQKPSTSLKVDEPEDDDNNKSARINSIYKVISNEKINFPSKDGINISEKSDDKDVKRDETSFFSGIRDKDIFTSTKIGDGDFQDNSVETSKECNSENSCDCSDSEKSEKNILGSFENCLEIADNCQMFSNDDKIKKLIDDKTKIGVNKKTVDFGAEDKKLFEKSDFPTNFEGKSEKKNKEIEKFVEVHKKVQNNDRHKIFTDKSEEKIDKNEEVDNEEVQNGNVIKYADFSTNNKNNKEQVDEDKTIVDVHNSDQEKQNIEVADFSDSDDISILGFKKNVEYYGKRRSVSTQTLTNFEMFEKNSFKSSNSKCDILDKSRVFEALKTIFEENEGKICSCSNVVSNYDYDGEEGKIICAEEYTLDDHDKIENDSSNLNHAVSQVDSTISLASKIKHVIPDVVEENIQAEPEHKCGDNYDYSFCDIDEIKSTNRTSTPERKREIENFLMREDSDIDENRDKNRIRSYSSRNLMEILADGQKGQNNIPNFLTKVKSDDENSENCNVINKINENLNNLSIKQEKDDREHSEIKEKNLDAAADKFEIIKQETEKSTDLEVENESFEFTQQEIEIKKSDHRKSASFTIDKDEFEIRKHEIRKSAESEVKNDEIIVRKYECRKSTDFGVKNDELEVTKHESKKSVNLNTKNGKLEVKKNNSALKNSNSNGENKETNVFQQEIEERNHNLQIPSKDNPEKKQNLLKKKSDIENVNKDNIKSSYKRHKNPSQELTESIKRRTSFSYEQEEKSDHNCEYFYLLDEIEETNRTSTPERKRDIEILLEKDDFPSQDLIKNKQRKYSNGNNGQAQKLGEKKNHSLTFQYDSQKTAYKSDIICDDSKFSRFSRNTTVVAKKPSDSKNDGEQILKASKSVSEKDQNEASCCHESDNISVCHCSDTDSEKSLNKISVPNTVKPCETSANKYQYIPRKRSKIKSFISAFCRKVRKFFSIFLLRRLKNLLKKDNNKLNKDVEKGFNITETFCEPKNCFNKIPTCDYDFSDNCGPNSCLNKISKNYNSIGTQKKANDKNGNNENKNFYRILDEMTKKNLDNQKEDENFGIPYHQPVNSNSHEFSCNGAAAYHNTCCKDRNNSQHDHWVELPIINSYNSLDISSTSCDCDQDKKLMYHRKYARRKSLEQIPLSSSHKKYRTRRQVRTRRRSDFSLFKSNRESYPCCYYKNLAAKYLSEYLNFRLRLHLEESDSQEDNCKECLESTDSELKSLLNEYIKTSRRERKK